MKNKEQARKRRKMAIRKKLSGTAEKPRVYLNKSNKYVYVGATDDETGKVFVTKKVAKGVENSKKCGVEVGKALMKLKIEAVVFDRSGYKYHGMTQAVAEGLREAGLKV